MYSCFKNFTNIDILNFLKEQGLEVKEERGNRFFPVTDKAKDVLDCFVKKIKELKINVYYNEKVEEIITNSNGEAIGIKTSSGEKKADKIIIATGGKSYPITGSTGDGYNMAEKVGHTLTDIKPSLVPLICYEKELCQLMQGLSLRNVSIYLEDISKKKKIYEDFGEMLFTHYGVSGPIVLSASGHLVRYKNIGDLLKKKEVVLHIDIKPALNIEKLDNRILRDFEEMKNKMFKNSLDKLLPQKMIYPIINLSHINPEKQVNQITKSERENLVKIIKDFKLTIKDFRPIDEAIITSGGISIKEINPSTMESKIVKNLYFAGEIIDVDAYTGGFNLQIAYSTGYTAGLLK